MNHSTKHIASMEASTNKINKLEGEVDKDVNEHSEKCRKWLEECTISDSCSVYSDSDNNSLAESTNSAMDSGFVFQNNGIEIGDRFIGIRDGSTSIIKQDNKDVPKYDKINIYKSKKVHVGDVTYINGPVIINNGNSAYNDRKLPIPYIDPFIGTFIIDRINWLAQPPLGEREYLSEPAPYVIIAHTASEEGFTQADNTLLIRLIQTFHIESRKWKDIAYNFLIGSDGLAYEGRGWGVVGSHTRGYNSRSVGIAFVGCFLNHLPPKAALDKGKELIEAGVERGSISPDYKLLAHCQCSAIESPGRKLFEELQTWKHWDASVAVPKSKFTCVVEEPPDDDFPK